MNDRLRELKRGAAAPEQVSLEIETGGGGGESLMGKHEEGFLSDFFSTVDVVKQHILALRQATKRVVEINQQVVLATTAEREAALSTQLAPLVAETNKKAANSKQLLQKLKEQTDSLKEQRGKGGAAELRVRENLVTTLTRKFVEVMKEYQAAQQKYKTDVKKKVKRQVQIVKPDATSEEVEAVLRSGGGSGEVFKHAILKGEASDSIRNAFMTVADKYQDVLTLEASVAELHQMFLDFALLTEQQGELLDQIEFQVNNAGEYIDDGNADMAQAIEYQISIRKKQACCAVIVLVVLGVLALIIYLVTSKK